MSNAAQIKKYMEIIICAINKGEANKTKTLKALAKGILMLAEDLEQLNKKDAAKDFNTVGTNSNTVGTNSNPYGVFGDMFGGKR